MVRKLYPGGKRKAVNFSYDDGVTQDVRFVELLNRYGIPCTFNLNSGFFGQKHRINHGGFDVCHDEIEASEVKELYRNHEIAVHTVSHPNLKRTADDSEVIRQVLEDYNALTEISGITFI